MSTGSDGEVRRILEESTPALSPKQALGLWAKAWAMVRGGWRAPHSDQEVRDQAAAETEAAVARALDEGRKKAGIV
jgi:hypothetical protein